jgi:hypothetical protein
VALGSPLLRMGTHHLPRRRRPATAMKFIPFLTALYFSGAQTTAVHMTRCPWRILSRFESRHARHS